MPERDGSLYGCGFWPLGWAEIVRLHAGDTADRIIDAKTLGPELCAAWLAATQQDAAGEGFPELKPSL